MICGSIVGGVGLGVRMLLPLVAPGASGPSMLIVYRACWGEDMWVLESGVGGTAMQVLVGDAATREGVVKGRGVYVVVLTKLTSLAAKVS